LQFNIDVRRIRRLPGDPDAPPLTLVQGFRDLIIMSSGRSETFEDSRDGYLLGRGKIRVAPQIF